MGNTIGIQRLEDLRSYLLESPDIVVHSLLATYKLFKVFHCAHEGFKHGGVIVKLFIPNESEEDDHTEFRIESLLKPYRDATFLVQCRFSGLVHPNVVPYESAEVLHHSGILVRQFFGRNLYDRMYSQPHLTSVHKVWVALQGLCAVAQLHSVGIIHGDIKNENFFLIGSFQAILTDLSTFIKPVFLPLNDPVAATSMFFESGGSKRRRCFIAPERFIDSLTSRVLDEHGRRMTFFDKEFTPDFVKMDLFSLGMSIAELFLDGEHVIDLPELLAYRTKNMAPIFEKISNTHIRGLVTKLVQLDPQNRPASATECIHFLLNESLSFGFKGLLIPLLALIGHPVYASADMRMCLLRANWGYICGLMGVEESKIPEFDRFTELDLFEQCQSASLLTRGINASIPPLTAWSHPSTTRVFPHAILNAKNCSQFTEKLVSLWQEGSAAHQHKTGADSWRNVTMPTRINEVYNCLWEESDDKSEKVTVDISVAPIVCSLLGSTVLASNATKSKLIYIEMVKTFFVSSESLSSYILPYLHDLCSSLQPRTVREAAMDALAILVAKLPEAETGLFSEYLFPLCLGPRDESDEQVRPLVTMNLAVALTESALKSSQESVKKVAAIRLFATKVIQSFSSNYSLIVSNLTLLSFLELDKARPLLLEILTQCLNQSFSKAVLGACCLTINSERVIPQFFGDTAVGINSERGIPQSFGDAAVANNGERIVPQSFGDAAVANNGERVIPQSFVDTAVGNNGERIVPQSFIDTVIVPSLCDSLRESNEKHVCETIWALGNLAETKTLKLILEALENIASKSLVVHQWTQHVIVNVIGKRISVVDQFVFLRKILTNFKLEKFVRNEVCSSNSFTALVPSMEDGHHVNVQIVNPFFSAPHAHNQYIPLSLKNFKDFRVETAQVPRALPDVGCLTSTDGTFMNLYAEQGSGSLQRKYLNTLPCIPIVQDGIDEQAVPESILLTTLTDFCSSGFAVPVVAIDSTDDGRLIVGAGADGTVRIWRTAALETDALITACRSVPSVNASRLFAVRTIRNSKSAVLGTDNRLMTMRLDGEGFSGQSQTHTFGNPIKIECFDTDFASCVFAACDKGGVINWDIRTNHFAFKLGQMGPLSGLVLSKNAHRFAVSTYTGELSVYDHRYLKPMHRWTHSSGPISDLAPSIKDFCAWVSTANEICLFDLESGNQAGDILSTVGPNGLVGDSPRLSETNVSPPFNTTALTQLVKSNTAAKAVVECATSNQWTVFSGHNDGIVRYWQPNNAGVAFPAPLETFPTVYNPNHIIQRIVKEGDSHALDENSHQGCTVTEGHRDAINDICIASLQYDMVVTAGRDGLVKLWK